MPTIECAITDPHAPHRIDAGPWGVTDCPGVDQVDPINPTAAHPDVVISPARLPDLVPTDRALGAPTDRAPVDHRAILTARLAQADARITELHAALTTVELLRADAVVSLAQAEQQRDQARAQLDRCRTAHTRTGAELERLRGVVQRQAAQIQRDGSTLTALHAYGAQRDLDDQWDRIWAAHNTADDEPAVASVRPSRAVRVTDTEDFEHLGESTGARVRRLAGEVETLRTERDALRAELGRALDRLQQPGAGLSWHDLRTTIERAITARLVDAWPHLARDQVHAEQLGMVAAEAALGVPQMQVAAASPWLLSSAEWDVIRAAIAWRGGWSDDISGMPPGEIRTLIEAVDRLSQDAVRPATIAAEPPADGGGQSDEDPTVPGPQTAAQPVPLADVRRRLSDLIEAAADCPQATPAMEHLLDAREALRVEAAAGQGGDDAEDGAP